MGARRAAAVIVSTATAAMLAVSAVSAPAQADTLPPVDLTAPTASIGALARFTAAPTVTVRYSGSDSGSGVKDYDLRVRTAAPKADFGAYRSPTAWQQRTDTSLTFPVTGGTDYCVSARSRDNAGNVSAWTSDACTAVALDDRAMTASRGWKKSSSSSAYRGTLTRSATYKSSLSATVRGRQLALVVTTCPSCGTVAILLGGTYWRTVNTRSSTTRRKVVLVQPMGSKIVTLEVTLGVASNRPVIVDGLATTTR